MPIFAVREHDTGEKRAECRRKPDHDHEQRDGNDKQQRRRGEQLAQSGNCDKAEYRPYQVVADNDNEGDGADSQ